MNQKMYRGFPVRASNFEEFEGARRTKQSTWTQFRSASYLEFFDGKRGKESIELNTGHQKIM